MEKIRDAIIRFHDEIKDVISVPSYVVDIAIFEDLSCHVIELNPFGSYMSSGAALFNWKQDGELLYGKLSLENPPIRILKELITEENKKDVGC